MEPRRRRTDTDQRRYRRRSGHRGPVEVGTYNLSESGPPGYTASDWVCTGGTSSTITSVTLAEGQNAICTITNTAIAPRSDPGQGGRQRHHRANVGAGGLHPHRRERRLDHHRCRQLRRGHRPDRHRRCLRAVRDRAGRLPRLDLGLHGRRLDHRHVGDPCPGQQRHLHDHEHRVGARDPRQGLRVARCRHLAPKTGSSATP